MLTLNTIALDEGKEQSFSVYLRAVEERPVSLTSVLMRQPSLKNLLDKTAGSKGPNATRKTPTRTCVILALYCIALLERLTRNNDMQQLNWELPLCIQTSTLSLFIIIIFY